MSDRPIGPEVDTAPRMLPARAPIQGQYCVLEPIHPRHAAELFDAAAAGTEAGDASWTYLGYGPFPSRAAMTAHVQNFAVQMDHVAWAIRPLSTGQVSGWLTLMDIQPRNAAIEIGNIWFGPRMQRTRAATEAIFLALRHAMDDLGYRRMVWKCNALNAPSRRAAERLGFTYEGLLRAHMVVKGRRRDTTYYSILDHEWPRCRDALAAWLDASNFAPDGSALRSLAAIRGDRTSRGDASC
jgi:RimJ/RimL family protein N-acetyltransferase